MPYIYIIIELAYDERLPAIFSFIHSAGHNYAAQYLWI